MYSKLNIMKVLVITFAIISLGFGQDDPPTDGGNAPITPLRLDNVATLISAFPYQVSVMFDGEHICGGAILSKYYVITAAHCTNDYLWERTYLSIRVGSSYQGNGGYIHNISGITQHPSFRSTSMDYDISILKLSTPIIYDDDRKAIPLATTSPTAGTIARVTGWSRLDEISSTAFQLQVSEVPIQSQDTCIASYKDIITGRMFCAGEIKKGRGSCSGDLGGPLAVGGKLVGIVAWMYGCAQNNFPAVYINIPSLISWIKSKVIFD